MWCPKCKCEYVEGISVCADCGCQLVDHMEEEENGQEAEAYEAVSGEEFSFDEEEEQTETKPAYSHPYVNNEEKANDNKSSAYTLLFVGGAGLLAVLLFFFDVISFHGSALNKYMISGVMGTMFVLFIIMGAVSMRNSKILAKKAGKEKNLTQEIRKWCMDNLSREMIDGETKDSAASDEIKYFQRVEKVKAMINNQFMNLDEGYLDRLVDEIYPEIFEP